MTLKEAEIESLIEQLGAIPWEEPENFFSPACWQYHLTDPMVKILEAGNRAQGLLLRQISNPKIREEIIFLLGGVGDEKAITPIIGTMADASTSMSDPKAKRLNLVANLALTNLTVSDVIWYQGGGIPYDRCPNDPKSCWTTWWIDHRSFKVGPSGRRLNTNYPNYGIHAQFSNASDLD